MKIQQGGRQLILIEVNSHSPELKMYFYYYSEC